MLTLKIGIWENEPGRSSGTFNLFGKKFMVFVDKNTNRVKSTSPEFWVTVKEHEPRKKD